MLGAYEYYESQTCLRRYERSTQADDGHGGVDADNRLIFSSTRLRMTERLKALARSFFMVAQKPAYLTALKDKGATGTSGDARKAWEELHEKSINVTDGTILYETA